MNPILRGDLGEGWVVVCLDDIMALIPQPWSNDSPKIIGEEALGLLRALITHAELAGAALVGFAGRIFTHTPEFQERVYAAESLFVIKVPVDIQLSAQCFRFWNLALCVEFYRRGLRVLRWNKYMAWHNNHKSHRKTFSHWFSEGVHDNQFMWDNYPEALENRKGIPYYIEPFL